MDFAFKKITHPLLLGTLWFLLFSFSGCKPDILTPDGDSINDLIQSLNYDGEAMLNYNSQAASAERTLQDSTLDVPVVKGLATDCRVKRYSLSSNFQDVAILQPTKGVIWPGALVVGDEEMLKGIPALITLPRAPMDLTIDLPGMRKRGVFTVADPSEGQVKVALDEALEWWNDKAYRDGYVNAANSSYQTATSYSSQQLALDLGLNYGWATGDVATQLNYTSSSSRKVVMMLFKQVFYTVSMEAPSSPAGFFGESVDLSDVQNVVSDQAPPAYVHSVSYGRIIMFRMETTSSASDVDLNAAFNYASGLTSASGELQARYESILQSSSITSITIGGNASVATQAISYENLPEVISGENAVYSRNNPGVPIAYTIRYLKDNRFARMGYTTDYETRECSPYYEFQHSRIRFRNRDKGTSQVRIKYLKGESQIAYNGAWRLDIDEDEYVDIYPPDGAYGVELEVRHDDAWPWGADYYHVAFKWLDLVRDKVCYEVRWSESADKVRLHSVSCN